MIFGREPVLILAAARAVVVCIMAFGLQLTPEQVGAIYLVVEAILSVAARSAVTPVDEGYDANG